MDYLADDYELGARVAKAGYRVALSAEVVETGVPAYDWSGFVDHQLRWARTVRDARPGGYLGLMLTHGLAWALLNLVASGLSPLSLWLLGLSFFLRLAQAMTVGARCWAITRCCRTCGCCRCATWWRWACGWRGLRGTRLCGGESGLC